MSDEVRTYEAERRPSYGLLLAVGVAGLVLALGALGWSYAIQHQMADSLSAAQQHNDKLQAQLEETNARLKATSEALGQSVGMTQKQLEDRAQSILKQQETARLEKQQRATDQQVSQVSNDVSGVQTDVGGVKTDVAATKTELKNAEAQMQSMKGDLGVQSGLIATNHAR